MPNRKSIRLRGYDYSRPGAYFVTVCAKNGICLFGKVEKGIMHLNKAGQIVRTTWESLPSHYRNLSIDEFVVMPNHVHGIVVLHDIENCARNGGAHCPTAIVGAGLKPAPTMHGLTEIIRAFKTFSSRKINDERQSLAILSGNAIIMNISSVTTMH